MMIRGDGSSWALPVTHIRFCFLSLYLALFANEASQHGGISCCIRCRRIALDEYNQFGGSSQIRQGQVGSSHGTQCRYSTRKAQYERPAPTTVDLVGGTQQHLE